MHVTIHGYDCWPRRYLCMDVRQVGTGDEQDKLVTIAVNPASPHYGNVIGHTSVGGRNEAITLVLQMIGITYGLQH